MKKARAWVGILAAVMAFVLIFSGCGSKADRSAIAGKWVAVADEVPLEGAGTLEVKMYLDLNEDGTLEMKTDNNEIRVDAKHLIEKYIDNRIAEANSSSPEEFRENFAISKGYTSYDKMEAALIAYLTQDFGDPLLMKGTWDVLSDTEMKMIEDGEKDGDISKYVLEGNKLTITEKGDNGEDVTFVFTKIA